MKESVPTTVFCHVLPHPFQNIVLHLLKETAIPAIINIEYLRNCVSGLLTISDNNNIIACHLEIATQKSIPLQQK